MMGLKSVQTTILYFALAIAWAGMTFLWKRLKRQSRLTSETLHELGLTYEGQWKDWDARQREMERITSELLVARDQQETLLGRNISNRSMRQEALGLLRGGAQPDSIAARLDLPRNEVRLLAKVQSILKDSMVAS